MITNTVLVLVLPFVMFLFLGLAGVKMPRKTAGVLGVAGMLVTTVLAYWVAID